MSFLLVLLVLLLLHTAADAAAAKFAGVLQPGRTYLFLVTDPHGVYSGHPHQAPRLSADYPALLSLVDSLRDQAKQVKDCHVHFFENGDLVDGGGLTSVPEGKRRMFPLLAEHMGFDARTFGNHELYVKGTVEALDLPGSFVTSNIVWRAKQNESVGHRYRVLDSGGDGKKILVLGFLYDMTNYDPTHVVVRDVEKCVTEQWFSAAVKQSDLSSIVVLAHMDYRHPLVQLVFTAIRALRQDAIPIVFSTGHTHQRRHRFLDSTAISLEAGKYMDTIGLVSFRNTDQADKDKADRDFAFEYLDPNHATFLAWAKQTQDSAKARSLRQQIKQVRDALELDQQVGWCDRTYTLRANLGSVNSIIDLWVHHVIEDALFGGEDKLFFVGGTGTIRYDLFEGTVTKDDLWVVSPFADPFHVVRGLPAWLIVKLVDPVLGLLQAKLHPLIAQLPLYTHSSLAKLKPLHKYDLVFGNFDKPYVMAFLKLHKFEHAASELFRADEGFNGHSVWEKYFEQQQGQAQVEAAVM